ncbi:MAG: metallophosphoesterase [Myxococcota bacterium]
MFVTVALSIVALLHYYTWARLVRDSALATPWSYGLTALLILAAIGTPVGLLLRRKVAASISTPVAWLTYLWMGSMFLLVVVLGASDVLRWVSTGVAKLTHAPWDISDTKRRQFMAQILGATAVMTTLGLSSIAFCAARSIPKLRKVRVGLKRLPTAMVGTTLVQITDLHVGPTIGRKRVEELVQRTNALKPDIVAITGDLVDGTVEELRDAVAPLAGLRARYGTYFVTGNHEYYSGATAWIAYLNTLGIRVLRNERVSIGDGENSFDLAGVDDASAHRFLRDHGTDVAKAVAGRDPSRELILLAHQPKVIEEAAKHGVGLQHCGHTHGGQIWPFRYIVTMVQPYF